MSFAEPLVLLGLIALPLLVGWYLAEQRRRRAAAVAFAAPALHPSVAPVRPRWRRHVPLAIVAL
ncbi:MAG TPA: BatA domain-containing protein, partial [Thermoleophilaceae bacterium]